MLVDLTERLFEHARPSPGEQVLDVGCGGGETTRQLARRLGTPAGLLGLDLSRPLIELARRAHPRLEFLAGDAQIVELETGSRDLVLSRFGVMFFDDPAAALANLRRILRPGGRLVFVCWAPSAGNPMFEIPREVAYEQLGSPDPVDADPRAPGPFSFAEADHVDELLTTAGFTDRTSSRESPRLSMGRLDSAVELMCGLGPAANRLNEVEATEEQRRRVAEALTRRISCATGPDSTVSFPSDVYYWTAR